MLGSKQLLTSNVWTKTLFKIYSFVFQKRTKVTQDWFKTIRVHFSCFLVSYLFKKFNLSLYIWSYILILFSSTFSLLFFEERDRTEFKLHVNNIAKTSSHFTLHCSTIFLTQFHFPSKKQNKQKY